MSADPRICPRPLPRFIGGRVSPMSQARRTNDRDLRLARALREVSELRDRLEWQAQMMTQMSRLARPDCVSP